MTTTTTPDAIVGWTTADPASQVSESQAQADSIQIAFNKRQAYTYRWANTAARTAQTGMVEDSQGYQTDTSQRWVYRSGAWILYDTGWLSSGITWNTNWAATAAYGYSSFSYRRVDKTIYLNGGFTWATTYSALAFTLPLGFRPSRKTIATVWTGNPGLQYFVELGTDGTGATSGSASAPFIASTSFFVD